MITNYFADSTTTAGVTYHCECMRLDANAALSDPIWRVWAVRASDGKTGYADGDARFIKKASLRASYTYQFPD